MTTTLTSPDRFEADYLIETAIDPRTAAEIMAKRRNSRPAPPHASSASICWTQRTPRPYPVRPRPKMAQHGTAPPSRSLGPSTISARLCLT
jgi:hypothetical protein